MPDRNKQPLMEPVFFLHIEKTAGTSLRTLIRRQFPDSAVCPAYHQDDVLRLSKTQVGGFRLFCGHYRYAVQEYVTPAMPRVVVMLRDPVQRTLSHLRHIQRDRFQNELLRERLPINDMSLEELATHPFIVDFLREFQTKKLGLGFDPQGIAFPLRLFDPAIRYDGRLLREAKRNLERCFGVGLTERFAESCSRLFSGMGWDPTGIESLHANKTPVDSDFELPEVMSEALNLDRELYRHAVELFESGA